MSLRQRLDRLEKQLRTSAECPTCGWPLHESADRRPVRMVVKFADEPDADDQPDYCPTCGRQLKLKLEFDHPRDPG